LAFLASRNAKNGIFDPTLPLYGIIMPILCQNMPKFGQKIFFSKNAGNALKHGHNRFGQKKFFFQPKSIDNTVISDTYKKKKKKKKKTKESLRHISHLGMF
jgi:hypothetical protein